MTAIEMIGQKDMYQPFNMETKGPMTAVAMAAPIPLPHHRVDVIVDAERYQRASIRRAHVVGEGEEP